MLSMLCLSQTATCSSPVPSTPDLLLRPPVLRFIQTTHHKTRSPLYNPHLNFLPDINTNTLICLSFFPFCASALLWFDMDSQNLKQRRIADDPNTTMNKNNYAGKREMRMKMAKRGLRSLAVAVSLPVALHLITIYLASTDSYRTASKPFWFLPTWGLRLTCLASSFLMGLSAWLVWAEGGFHKNPMALPLYLSQLILSLAWDPIVFGAGAPWVGLVVCMGMFGALVGCSKVFQDVNATAGDLMKPCLAWVAFLAVVNLKLVYL